MPYKEKKIEKLYWTIGEVAEDFGVNTSLLRYWEKEFDELRPERTSKNGRRYTKKDRELVRLIRHLLKDQGYTIQGAKEKLRTDRKGVETNTDIMERLLRIRSLLIEVKGGL
jgi:DNA-binding transcriptional MerR regulator